MSRYLIVEDENIITAEQLNQLFEEHINKTLEDAHPYWREKLFEHIADTTAHNLISRLDKVISEHKKDPKAHWEVVEEIQSFLNHHTHPELAPLIETDLVGLIEEHKKKGHYSVVETLGKAYLSDRPPERTDIPDNFLWLNTKDNKLYLYRQGKWVQIGFSNPYTVDEDLFWVMMCLTVCGDVIFSAKDWKKVLLRLQEHLPFINFHLMADLLKVSFDDLKTLFYGDTAPENLTANKLSETASYWLYTLVFGYCVSL